MVSKYYDTQKFDLHNVVGDILSLKSLKSPVRESVVDAILEEPEYVAHMKTRIYADDESEYIAESAGMIKILRHDTDRNSITALLLTRSGISLLLGPFRNSRAYDLVQIPCTNEGYLTNDKTYAPYRWHEDTIASFNTTACVQYGVGSIASIHMEPLVKSTGMTFLFKQYLKEKELWTTFYDDKKGKDSAEGL